MPHAASHGVPIYWESHGDGPLTLLFAHGMGGNAAIWYQQVARFAPGHRVIVFDHRGFARSPCAPEAFDPRRFPDDACAVLDAAGVDRAVLVCQSMGGWTGSQMALRHPDRVLGLLMSHTPGVFTHVSAVNDARAVAARVSAPPTGFATPALGADYPARNPAGAALYRLISNFNTIEPALVPRAIAAAGVAVDTATLVDYRVPTLFVGADHDVLFPAPFLAALAATLPGARFVNLGDAGHSSYFEIPDAFNATLADFIAGLPGAPR
jgi:3-oxoadipate enol-lactonase